jgi:hypothetical protein
LIKSLITEVSYAAAGDNASLEAVVQVVAKAVQAFLEANGVPHIAARKVGRPVRRLGVDTLPPEIDDEELGRAFQRAKATALQASRALFDRYFDRDDLVHLLDKIAEYLTILQAQARHGLSETQRLRKLDEERRAEELRRALFHSVEPIDVLASIDGHDLRAAYVALVSVGGPLPREVTDAPGAIAGSPHEAVVPHDLIDRPEVRANLRHQLVVGPPVSLEDMPEAVELTRRAARLLATGTAAHPDVIVPCGDMIGSLAVAGSPLLNELAARKHLAPMLKLRDAQRLDYAQLLLLWLERGQPLAQIAHLLDVPAQTAHHRFTVIRQLYGERLDDPNTRLEILLALRHMLPRWRAELAHPIPAARNKRARS